MFALLRFFYRTLILKFQPSFENLSKLAHSVEPLSPKTRSLAASAMLEACDSILTKKLQEAGGQLEVEELDEYLEFGFSLSASVDHPELRKIANLRKYLLAMSGK